MKKILIYVASSEDGKNNAYLLGCLSGFAKMMLENERHAEAPGGRRMEWERGQGTEGAACMQKHMFGAKRTGVGGELCDWPHGIMTSLKSQIFRDKNRESP